MVEKQRSVSNQNQRFQRPRPNTSGRRRSRSHRYDRRDGRTRYELSVVIPLYNEEESVDELAREVKNALSPLGLSFEVIFVDDGSTDRSFDRLKEIHRHDRRFRIIRFRRNYGKSAALSVGFRHAGGSYIMTLDADLQDDPSEIPRLLDMLRNDYDLVSGWKKKRHDPISKKVPSRLFNFVVSKMTGIKIHDFNCGLKGYRREVVQDIQLYGELHRYIPVLAHWAGYHIGELVVEHHPRKYGTTKFGLGRFWKGFLDLLTVLFTTRFIRRPLHLFGLLGLVAFITGVVIDAYLSVLWLLKLTALSNRPLFIAGFVLIIVGIQFISIGLIGEMITKGQQFEREYSIREIVK